MTTVSVESVMVVVLVVVAVIVLGIIVISMQRPLHFSYSQSNKGWSYTSTKSDNKQKKKCNMDCRNDIAIASRSVMSMSPTDPPNFYSVIIPTFPSFGVISMGRSGGQSIGNISFNDNGLCIHEPGNYQLSFKVIAGFFTEQLENPLTIPFFIRDDKRKNLPCPSCPTSSSGGLDLDVSTGNLLVLSSAAQIGTVSMTVPFICVSRDSKFEIVATNTILDSPPLALTIIAWDITAIKLAPSDPCTPLKCKGEWYGDEPVEKPCAQEKCD